MGDKTEVVLFGILNGAGPALPIYVGSDGKLAVTTASVENDRVDLFTSASRTATTNSLFKNNLSYRGGHIVINVTSITGTPSVVPVFQAPEHFTFDYYDLLRGNAITTTGMTILKLYPGITPVPNLSANDILPTTYRLRMEHADTDAITYTAYISLIL